MSNQLTVEQLEQQVAQLPLHEQLKLVAYICERLSLTTQALSKAGDDEALRQQRQQETEALLALCEAAAEQWTGTFDAAEEIRQMRQERDEQLWRNRS